MILIERVYIYEFVCVAAQNTNSFSLQIFVTKPNYN
jgi:hypothetical protein